MSNKNGMTDPKGVTTNGKKSLVQLQFKLKKKNVLAKRRR